METWNALIARVAAAGGVGTPADARAAGVSEATWHRRTREEGWLRPHTGVRVAPWARGGPMTDLRAALAACRGHGVAAAETAAWLGGVGPVPRRFELLVPHGGRVAVAATPRLRVRAARWLVDDDRVEVDGVARLDWPATVVSLAGLPAGRVRGLVIDLVQAGKVTPDEASARLQRVGPLPGRGVVDSVLGELGARRPESVFHDDVLRELEDRGYPVSSTPRDLPTPDGRGIVLDIPIDPFRLAVEPEGDTYHRGATARRNDRRRHQQATGGGWVLFPVDWKDWHERRGWVLASLDAAILDRFRAGIGTRDDLPPHLRAVAA